MTMVCRLVRGSWQRRSGRELGWWLKKRIRWERISDEKGTKESDSKSSKYWTERAIISRPKLITITRDRLISAIRGSPGAFGCLCLFKPKPRPDASDDNVAPAPEAHEEEEMSRSGLVEPLARHGGTGRLWAKEDIADDEFSPIREEDEDGPADEDEEAPYEDGGAFVV